MKKELFVVVCEIMGVKSWVLFKVIFVCDVLFGEIYLYKIWNEGVIWDEDEYCKVFIEFDLLINGVERVSFVLE